MVAMQLLWYLKLGDTVVRHVPYNLAPIFSHFLARDFNKGIVYITGEGLIEVLDTDLKSHTFIICTADVYRPSEPESSRRGSHAKFS